MSTKNFFIVCSAGHTASRWFSRALNQHPEIYTIHGGDEPEDGSARDMEVVDTRLRNGVELRPEYLIPRMEAAQKATHYGAIHRNSIRMLDTVIDSSHLYAATNMVRHPITRIEGLYGNWVQARHPFIMEAAEATCDAQADFINSLCNKYGLDISDIETKLFLTAICYTWTWADEVVYSYEKLGFNPMQHIQMERITSDIEYFCWIIKKLTGCTFVNSGLEFLDTIFEPSKDTTYQKIDSNRTFQYRCAEELFDQYPDWKQDAIRTFMGAHDTIISVNSALGYDMAFVE